MPGSLLLSVDLGDLLPDFRMLLDSCNHAGSIRLAARALQVPGNGAVGVLSYLRGGYYVAVIGTLIHHVLSRVQAYKALATGDGPRCQSVVFKRH